MINLEKPSPTLPPNYRPPGAAPYRVRNGDSFTSIANRLGMSAKALLQFNYKTDHPPYINYYLKHNVGCKVAAPDGKNYSFTNASPGVIYQPMTNPVVMFMSKEGGPVDHFGSSFSHGLVCVDYPNPPPKFVDHIKVYASFAMGLRLNPKLLDPTPFVYRQFIKGSTRVKDDLGKWWDIPTRVPTADGKAMQDWKRDDWLEDGEEWVDPITSAIDIRKYGYREKPGVAIDRYLPDQKGHAYEMFDQPGFPVPKTNLRHPRIPGPPSGRFPKLVETEFSFMGLVIEHPLSAAVPSTPFQASLTWDFKGKWRIVSRWPLKTEAY